MSAGNRIAMNSRFTWAIIATGITGHAGMKIVRFRTFAFLSIAHNTIAQKKVVHMSGVQGRAFVFNTIPLKVRVEVAAAAAAAVAAGTQTLN